MIPFEQTEKQIELLGKKVPMANQEALGAWNFLSSMNSSTLAVNSFSGVMSTLLKGEFVMYTAISQAVNVLFFKDRPSVDQNILNMISSQNQSEKDRLFGDNVYGLGSLDTIPLWVMAAHDGVMSDSAIILANHFLLTRSQLSAMIGIMKKNLIHVCKL